MQAGVGDRHAADEDRLKLRRRRDFAGAPHADGQADQPGAGFFRREFVGDGAARVLSNYAELTRLGETVDFQDHAIDFEGQVVPSRFPIGQAARHFRQIDAERGLCDDVESHVAQEMKRLPLAPQFYAVVVDDGVDVGGQLAFGGFAAVLLFQRAGGGIARVDISGQSLRLLLAIELKESLFVKENLSAHGQPPRRRAPLGNNRNAQGDRANCLHVGGDIIAKLAIAAGGRADQDAVFIADDDRQAIELGL